MSGTTRSSEGLDERRRRAAVPRLASRHARGRPDHRAALPTRISATLSEAELDEFEQLMDVPEPDLLAWVTGAAQTPAELRHGRCSAGCATFNRGAA